MIARAIAVFISGLAVFIAPGAFVLHAARVEMARGERIGFEFAASLTLLTAAFAGCLALGTSIDAAPVAVAICTAAAGVALRLALARRSPQDVAAKSALADQAPRRPAVPFVILSLLVVSSCIAAVAFAPLGSVDRWWYLAYVRSWLESPVLTLAEPFLGTGQAFARFTVHPWLFGLAVWSRMSGADPVVIYERAAPVLVVLASVSAAYVLAVRLFGRGRRARICVVATMLAWTGAALPVLARAGEDKVLAASALIPLSIAGFLGVVRGNGDAAGDAGGRDDAACRNGSATRDWCLLVFTSIATAAVHALAYAFVLILVAPLALVLFVQAPERKRTILAAGALLGVLAIAPAIAGIVVHGRLQAIGAELSAADHPVVRVHEGRDRLIELPVGGYVVSPRLIAHPLTLLALAALAVLMRARLRDFGTSREAVAYLSTATIVPLALAFVPPLPALLGSVIPPWMVYRVLWLLPIAPLAALAADVIASRFAARELAATTLLLVLGLPVVVLSARDRLAEPRERVAAPRSEDFRALVEAEQALPGDALVVAAPELAERLPAFAARHVVAGLDRSTIVFSGSRDAGEARLRARAAVLAGDDDAGRLAAMAGVTPTHAVFDPREAKRPRCGAMLYSGTAFALCALARTQANAQPERGQVLEATSEHPPHELSQGRCSQTERMSRRNPWSAAPPVVRCTIPLPAGEPREDLLLEIEAVTGRAVDELCVAVTGPEHASATTRLSGHSTLDFVLPSASRASVEVEIRSSFLPFVNATHVAIGAR